MNARNSLKSLAVSSDSEPEVEPFITQTKAALVAVLQELSENNLNLHLRVQKTSKQLTISIFAPRIFRPTCMFIDKEDSGEGSLHNCTWQGNSTFYREQLAKKKPSTQLESKVAKFEKRFVENEGRWSSPKSRNCTDVCMVRGTNLSPTIQTSRLFGSISSLSLDVPPLNFVSCWWIFAYCSL